MPIMHIEYWDGCDQVSSALKFKRALTPLDFYKTVLSLKQRSLFQKHLRFW